MRKCPSMTNRESKDVSFWLTKSRPSSELQLYVRGVPVNLNKELLAIKSAKVAAILEEDPHADLSYFLRKIPADDEVFEIVARFCHGFELQISTENVVPLACIAYYLEMTESHCRNNLFSRAFTFFEQKVIPSWNETIKAIRVAENFLQQAVPIGLVDACLESLIAKALADPRLLGTPIRKEAPDDNSEDVDDGYRPNARRRLFVANWASEDLTTLSLRLYEPIIRLMKQHRVPSEYVAASIWQYAKRWVFSSTSGGDHSMSICNRNSCTEVIEAVERLLPDERGLVPCTFLFEMLRYAMSLEASSDCITGFEIRIGKQLDQATVNDLLIPTKCCAKEEKYDTECLRRILKNFYGCYSCSDISMHIKVAELIEEFLAQVATDIDLKMETFISIADMLNAILPSATERNCDGIYRAIDLYLDKHKYLTELEREEVCKVLDCHKMSAEACDHAAKNERLPLRVIVQVLFVVQLQLRNTIIKENMQPSDERLIKEEVEEAEDYETKVSYGEDQEVMKEIQKMSNKVMEIERECHMMRNEIDNTCNLNKKGKISIWKEMKRKFGCITTMHDCNCHAKQTKKKKVHPRFAL